MTNNKMQTEKKVHLLLVHLQRKTIVMFSHHIIYFLTFVFCLCSNHCSKQLKHFVQLYRSARALGIGIC